MYVNFSLLISECQSAFLFRCNLTHMNPMRILYTSLYAKDANYV